MLNLLLVRARGHEKRTQSYSYFPKRPNFQPFFCFTRLKNVRFDIISSLYDTA